MTPELIQKLADQLRTLPGIGPRQALRLAFHLATLDPNETNALATAIEAISRIKRCTDCFFVFSGNGTLCEICSNPRRDPGIIAVVEKETDLISLEQTKQVTGRYCIIGNLRKDGVLTQEHKRRLKKLRARAEALPKTKAEEIILALSPTTYGDINASVLTTELAPLAKKITRLGRGIPTGGEIEFADDETLNQALKNRG